MNERCVCRTPPGVRELKQSGTAQGVTAPARRTPPGVRELKRHDLGGHQLHSESHPSQGA